MNVTKKNKEKNLKLTTFGFTLIELLGTILILSIIVVIAIPIISNNLEDFQEKNYQNLVKNIENVTLSYVNDNRSSLKDLDYFGYINVSLRTLVEEEYLEGNLKNPKTKEEISLDDIVYVTLDYKNKVAIIYDSDQNENDKITLNGNRIIKLKIGDPYIEYGVVAIDKNGNNVSDNITIDGNVNTNWEDVYEIKYYTDKSLIIKRYVIVTSDVDKEDIEPPVLTSNVPENYIETRINNNITLPIVTATDNVDGVINNIAPSFNNVDITMTGTYNIKYNFTDSSGNKADTLIIKVVVRY